MSQDAFRRYLFTALLLLSVLIYPASGTFATPAPGTLDGGRYVPGQVLVQYKAGVSAAEQSRARAAVGASSARTVRAASAGKGRLELASFASGRSVSDVIRAFKSRSSVAFAEPNWVYSSGATSNDPFYTDGSLWGMYGDATTPANQYGSQAGEAWAGNYTGSKDVYIGVIDEGIDYNHPDLSANIWNNPLDPQDGVDNDGNGYVDDVRGWDFANGDNTIYDGSPTDSTTDAHGTHVSGTIGGVGGNGTGVAGVNWNVTLISAKFLGANGGTTANAVLAVDYLTNLKTKNGLNIVASNNSWGGGGYSQALYDAIERANAANILFIAAAGNGGSDGRGDNIDSKPSYPASYTNANVVSVAAIDKTGAITSFSNYGSTSVDLGAPGAAVYSSTPNSGYSSYSGTSMATPHVTGAAALYASANPGATAATIKSALLNTTTATSSLSGKTVTGGRLNVSALMGTEGSAPPPPATGALSTTVSTDKSSYLMGETVRITVSVTDGTNPVGGASVSLTTTTASGKKYSGTGTTDASGNAVFNFKPRRSDGTGTYSTSATATKSGYTTGSGSTTFTVSK